MRYIGWMSRIGLLLMPAVFIVVGWGSVSFGGEFDPDPALMAELKKIKGFENKVVRPLAPMPKGPFPGPPDNPTTPAKAALGAKLFFDPRLSGDTSTPCVKCHDPKAGWGTADDESIGYPGTMHFRNSQTVLNTGSLKKLFWEGREGSLESQFWAAGGGESANNMTFEMARSRLSQIPEYVKLFQEVFNEPPTAGNIGMAGAAFQRTLNSDPEKVPFDRYRNGDKTAMTPEAIKGMGLFVGKARCILCHDGFAFVDEDFHNLAIPRNPVIEEDPLRQIEMRYRAKVFGVRNYMEVDQDLGLYFQTHRKEDIQKFRTQPIRELKYTAPYFHNGTSFTLEDVVEFYNKGGGEDIDNSYGTKSPLLKKLDLTDAEKKSIVAFLEALSSPEPPFVNFVPELPNYNPPMVVEEPKKAAKR